ncbi:MAG: putative exosortase B-associated extracellular polysaccharide biosynthesis transporter EpsL [Rhodocyclaceae bacterium]|nr:putative exosortase B-associated extracellular polysaccharide biosynthesis transporter EpsL [Rhodocyclaceae bacterium]
MNYHDNRWVYFRVGGIFCSLLCFGTPGDALADAEDTLNFLAGATYRQEDNLYRLPSGMAPLPVLGKDTKADQVRISYVGIKFDRTYSLQRFQLDATATNYRYHTFGRLNFDAHDLSGKWLWRITPKFSGSISVERQQTQINLADNRNFAGAGTRTIENRRFNADWWVHGSWHFLGGASEYLQRNSQSFVAEDSFRYRAKEGGVRYVAESGSSVTLLKRNGHGEYLDRTLNAASLLDIGFDQSETELNLVWLLSGKSTLNGRLTRVDRKHEHFASRDYHGTTGKIDYTWLPTGKLKINVAATRDIASYQELGNSYYINTSLVFSPVWQMSGKVSLRARLEKAQRDFYGPVVPVTFTRHDQTRSALIGLDWTATRAFSLGASLQHDTRSSNNANLEYKANTASVTAQLIF